MDKRSRIGGFTIVELIVVIVVIAILATVSIMAYNGIQTRARDAQRLADVDKLVKNIEIYLVRNGKLPPAAPSGSSWRTSVVQPADYISGITGEGTELKTLPVDPKNSGGMYYQYYVYPAGYSTCDGSRGPFYVLQVMDMESTGRPHPDSPGFSCPGTGGRNWSNEADYTVGGYTY